MLAIRIILGVFEAGFFAGADFTYAAGFLAFFVTAGFLAAGLGAALVLAVFFAVCLRAEVAVFVVVVFAGAGLLFFLFMSAKTTMEETK